MIARLIAAATLAACAAMAQGFAIRAWFEDGAGLELYTKSGGGPQPTSVSGGGLIRSGVVSRIVVDSQKNTVFAYDLEAERAGAPGTVNIRIKPVSHLDGNVPTVSSVRQFPAVRVGQEVELEILVNPATGERVYDVLRPIDLPNPSGRGPVIQGVGIPTAGSLKLVVNGQALAVRNGWTTGSPARLYLPGHGAYYLSWQSLPNFRLAGYVEKNRLVFLVDTEYVELTGEANMMKAERGPVWIYRDPDFRGGPQAELSVMSNLEKLSVRKSN